MAEYIDREAAIDALLRRLRPNISHAQSLTQKLHMKWVSDNG